jgi:phosphoribosylamine--glycine ligase
MKILVIGSGGREHAIVWRLKQNGHKVFGAPGNPGIAREGVIEPRTDYLAAALAFDVDLTVVGPEAPLVAGIVDQFRAQNLKIVGPDRANAQLEASKTYSKRFMQEAGIPTARSEQVDNFDSARKALKRFPLPVVIKADGLAAGKGVVIAHTQAEAAAAIESLGPKLVIEEFLTGEEVSFIALCDGRNVLALEPTQDHKAVHDNDQGPNTGGMGAYCDSRILTAQQSAQIMETVIRPVVDRTGFTGFLYAGLMMTAEGPKTLEFNVRLGDPETQVLMHRMDCDFGEILLAAAENRLSEVQFASKPDPSVAVVVAAQGYPGTVRTGDEIRGIAEAESKGAIVYHAGTRIDTGRLVTAGGRVLAVTDSGPTLRSSIERAYAALTHIHFDGMHYRRDIGRKGLARWSS